MHRLGFTYIPKFVFAQRLKYKPRKQIDCNCLSVCISLLLDLTVTNSFLHYSVLVHHRFCFSSCDWYKTIISLITNKCWSQFRSVAYQSHNLPLDSNIVCSLQISTYFHSKFILSSYEGHDPFAFFLLLNWILFSHGTNRIENYPTMQFQQKNRIGNNTKVWHSSQSFTACVVCHLVL